MEGEEYLALDDLPTRLRAGAGRRLACQSAFPIRE